MRSGDRLGQTPSIGQDPERWLRPGASSPCASCRFCGPATSTARVAALPPRRAGRSSLPRVTPGLEAALAALPDESCWTRHSQARCSGSPAPPRPPCASGCAPRALDRLERLGPDARRSLLELHAERAVDLARTDDVAGTVALADSVLAAGPRLARAGARPARGRAGARVRPRLAVARPRRGSAGRGGGAVRRARRARVAGLGARRALVPGLLRPRRPGARGAARR